MKKRLLLLALSLTGLSMSSQIIWQPYNANMDTTVGIRFLDVVDTNTVWAVGYDGTYTARTYTKFTRTIDGQNFVSGNFLPDTMDYNPSNLSAVNDTMAFIACYSKDATMNGQVLKTIDGGVTWNNVASTLMYNGAANFPNVVHFWDVNNGWTMGDPNNTNSWGNEYEIWLTSDGGATWTRTPGANIPAPLSGEYGLTDVYTTNGTNKIWYGTNKGRVFRSVDGGLNWLVSTPGGMAGGVNGLAFRDSLNGLCWGTSATTNGVFVLKRTSDGGATWTAITVSATDVGRNDICAVPNKGFMSVGINNGQTAYVTSVSYNDGLTWLVLEQGVTNTERMLEVEMVDTITGWAGNFSDNTLPSGFGGMAKYTGPLINSIRPVAEVVNSMVYPNPSNGVVNLKLEKVKAGTVISVRNILGAEVYNTTLTTNDVNKVMNIDLSKQEKGIYLVTIINGNSTQVQKVIIE
jgi:photosystem II stability/assembly factor-like uncharacterized protein